METGFASGTAEVEDGSVAGQRAETIGRAARAVEFAGGPRFAGDAGALGGAGVVREAFGGHAEVHVGIRSWTVYCKEGEENIFLSEE